MKTIKENISDNILWKQVLAKIKNADADRRNENQRFMNKVKVIVKNQGSEKMVG
ncbi:hypothetical protein [Pedobacter sp. L105]|uniref:hypothetical protein n=1 Tax=Pedobacter sp. L105 TaxID=1641871 RepID=UPI00131BC4D6|nr:hypothetical protein [Pedobacter sp. L105]